MPEQENKPDIYRIKQDGNSNQQEQMEIETARNILQAIVNTHEDTIDEKTPLNSIGGYTTEQIRQAMRTVAVSIFEKSSLVNVQYSIRIDKHTPQGKLTLILRKNRMQLGLIDKPHGKSSLGNIYSLEEISGKQERNRGFHDDRSGQEEGAHWSDLSNPEPLESFRKLLRGTRWMSANLLHWNNPETIMPEQLDSLAIPKPSSVNTKDAY